MNENKAKLLAALKPKTKDIQIEGYGPAKLKQLTVGEMDALRAALDKDDKSSAFGLRLLGASLVDDSGARIFGDEDIEEMKAAGSDQVNELVKQALEFGGLNKGDAAKN